MGGYITRVRIFMTDFVKKKQIILIGGEVSFLVVNKSSDRKNKKGLEKFKK